MRQTIEDCLHRGDGRRRLPRGAARLRDGRIRRVAVDTTEPSAFARGILNADAVRVPRRRAARGAPHAGGDDAARARSRRPPTRSARSIPTRSRACARRRGRSPRAPRRCTRRCSGWATSPSAEADASGWSEWLDELRAAGRVGARVRRDDRRGAGSRVEAPRDPAAVLRGRLEALGPVMLEGGEETAELGPDGWRPDSRSPAHRWKLAARARGPRRVLRCRLDGRAGVVRAPAARAHPALHARPPAPRDRAGDRRRAAGASSPLAARRPRATASRVRAASPRWCASSPASRSRRRAWEASVLPARVRDYRPEWLDQLTLTGELAWGRLWGAGNSAIRSTPICLVPREDLDVWLALAACGGLARRRRRPDRRGRALSTYARTMLERARRARRRASRRSSSAASGLLPSHFEMGLGQLIGHGLVTCDSFGGLRRLITPPAPAPRRAGAQPAGAGRDAGRASARRPPGDRGRPSARRESLDRVRGPPAARALRRRVPPAARARAAAGAVARSGARLPAAASCAARCAAGASSSASRASSTRCPRRSS